MIGRARNLVRATELVPNDRGVSMALPWKLHADGKNVSSDAIELPEKR